MGNWRRVQITGACAASEVSDLRDILALDFVDPHWGALHNGGVCGLPNWAAENINVVGNLGERDYSPEAVAQAAEDLSQVAPSLCLEIHCGGNYESDECVATVILRDELATVVGPKIPTVPALNEVAMRTNLFARLSKPQ